METSATIEPRAFLGGQRASLSARLHERLRSRHLDRELACGARPGSNAALAAHARRLLEPKTRVRLARALEGALADAKKPVGFTSRVPLRGPAIDAARTELESLTAELRTDDNCSPRGVALARLLVLDGASPLYGPGPDQELINAAAEAYHVLRLGEVS
jgi:hypothetical protein